MGVLYLKLAMFGVIYMSGCLYEKFNQDKMSVGYRKTVPKVAKYTIGISIE